MSGRLVLFLALLCGFLLSVTNSAKILSVAFVGTKSHKITYEPLLFELGARGHEVTILSYSLTNKKAPNVKDVLLIEFDEFMKNSNMLTLYEMKEQNIDINPFKMLEMMGRACENTYDLPQVKEILTQKFDLIFTEAIFNECVAGLIHKLNASLILVSPLAAPTWVATLLGSPSPPSFVPGMFGTFTDRMTFTERIMNFLADVTLTLVRDWSFKPAMEELYRRKLNDSLIPTSDEIFRKASLVLSCSHFSVNPPRPFLPDIVEVGGMHLEPAKALPKDLAKFADNAGTDGFIYFSFGSALKGSEMSEKHRQTFVKVFSRLKQKVLWKWETETMENLPPNVKLGKWLPQQDILGHPNCKLFITHGGLGGTTEAIYHGVPLVGIPMFGDQPLNLQKAETAGYALAIDYLDLTEENLYAAINRVIGEPKFRERIQHLSKIYRDQNGKPLDRALFWTEYVLRHNGAPHLRSPARDLNFVQYHSLDVIFTVLGLVFVVLYVALTVCRLCLRRLCGRSTSKPHQNGHSKKKTN